MPEAGAIALVTTALALVLPSASRRPDSRRRRPLRCRQFDYRHVLELTTTGNGSGSSVVVVLVGRVK
jgi:hypothetical protein